ncbi:MAG: hypothetical protein MK110_09495 [Fuerstiella sp.]|nr:hypothetical protein [Fuerstiella sp.]
MSFAAVIWPSAVAELKTTSIPRYDDALARAVSFLQSVPGLEERETSLVAYALLKAGVDRSEPRLVQGIHQARQRADVATYDQYSGSYLAAVDAMLLADIDGRKYRRVIQKIARMIESYQRSDGSWPHNSPRLGPSGPADISLTQYCVLALWAAKRAGCEVNPRTFDKAASYLIEHENPGGGWPYKIPITGASDPSRINMTVAGLGTIGICRMLLFSGGGQAPADSARVNQLERLGVLDQSEVEMEVSAYHDYNPDVSLRLIDECIARGVAWNEVRYAPVPIPGHRLYFYYTLERAAAFVNIRDDWFTFYGDGLLTLQRADGHFEGKSLGYGAAVETCFAILYFTKATDQIFNYGKGVLKGGRDLLAHVRPGGANRKKILPLDELLTQIERLNISDLPDDLEIGDVVKTVQFTDRKELIGEAEKLKVLVRSPDPGNRQVAYWALSRTRDFDLIPLMLDGIQDPNFQVSTEAVASLRYIARRPDGFGLSLNPLSQLPADADKAAKLNAAQVWKDKASRVWRQWYSEVRPYAQRDGLDEIDLPVDRTDR